MRRSSSQLTLHFCFESALVIGPELARGELERMNAAAIARAAGVARDARECERWPWTRLALQSLGVRFDACCSCGLRRICMPERIKPVHPVCHKVSREHFHANGVSFCSAAPRSPASSFWLPPGSRPPTSPAPSAAQTPSCAPSAGSRSLPAGVAVQSAEWRRSRPDSATSKPSPYGLPARETGRLKEQ